VRQGLPVSLTYLRNRAAAGAELYSKGDRSALGGTRGQPYDSKPSGEEVRRAERNRSGWRTLAKKADTGLIWWPHTETTRVEHN